MASRCVYLYGWFGYRNLGDDLLLEVVLDRLSSIPVVGSIEVAVHEAGYLEELFARHPKARPSHRSVGQLFGAAGRNDVLVVGPGGLFPHTDARKVAAFAAAAAGWRARGRDVAFFLIGANARQDALSRALWRGIARASTLFAPRDKDLFEACGIAETSSSFAAADAVLSLRPERFFELAQPKKRVAFAFANICEGDERSYEALLASCVEIVESAARDGNPATLLSFTAGSDERLNRDIASAVGGAARALPYEETMHEVRRLRDYEAVVGMRFHACVLAILGGVALVPISYSSKTERLVSDCGMGGNLAFYCKDEASYYGRVIPLDARLVSNQLRTAIEDPCAYRCGGAEVAALRRKSEMAFDSLEKLLRGG